MICEGCIKQDVCKYRGVEGDVERFERIMEGVPMEALEVTCAYKVVSPKNWDTDTTTLSGTYWPPNITWTDCYPYSCTQTCGKEW